MLIAVVILVTISVVLTISFNAIYRTTTIARNESELIQNARVAIDLIARDIQCIYYENGKTPFWHKGKGNDLTPPTDRYNNDLLCFISDTPLPATGSTSNVSEIKYQLSNGLDGDTGWLLRSVTSDNSDSWNFINASYSVAFTADTASSEEYEKVIPYVIDLSFTCYDNNQSVLAPESTAFPYSIDIELKLVDRDTWKKWDEDNSYNKEKYERLFTKSVSIGNRGQYD